MACVWTYRSTLALAACQCVSFHLRFNTVTPKCWRKHISSIHRNGSIIHFMAEGNQHHLRWVGLRTRSIQNKISTVLITALEQHPHPHPTAQTKRKTQILILNHKDAAGVQLRSEMNLFWWTVTRPFWSSVCSAALLLQWLFPTVWGGWQRCGVSRWWLSCAGEPDRASEWPASPPSAGQSLPAPPPPGPPAHWGLLHVTKTEWKH